MFSVALLLLLAAGSCVKCEQLTQPAFVTVQPGQRLTITCQVSYSVTTYATVWIRQPAGKGLEWIGWIYTEASYYKDSLKNKFSLSLESSSKTVTLNGQNVQPEDTAVYYCARAQEDIGLYFDYWGKGTDVTVTTASTVPPTVFPLIQCNPGSGDKITVGCLAYNFSPKNLNFQWTDVSGAVLTSIQYPHTETNNKYTAASFIQVSKSDYDSRKSFKCSVNHDGSVKTLQVPKFVPAKITLLSVPNEDTQALVCTIEDSHSGTFESFKWKKNGADLRDYSQCPLHKTGSLYSVISVLKVKNTDWDSNNVYTCEIKYNGNLYIRKTSKAFITMTLKQPSVKAIFSNNQAELECVITGQDKTVVSETDITWEIDGKNVTNSITSTSSGGAPYSKTSKMTQNYEQWKTVNKVRCSAIRKDMTPVIQDLTVQKGDGSQPKVAVHVLPVEDIGQGDSAKVTLVCLISSPVQQDYYIAWSEYHGQTPPIYTDGVNFPPQKTENGYSVTSVYTTNNKNWKANFIYDCNVMPVGTNVTEKSGGMSKAKAMGNSIECDK